MTIECKYVIGDPVKITVLEKTQGRVLSIWIDGYGTQYQVRYFNQGKGEKEYFFENELELVK
jgi:uncharacterized protein YodC (DUF2158 family)